MTGTKYQPDEFADARIEARLQDYGTRWRAATTGDDHDIDLTALTNPADLGHGPVRPSRPRSPWLVATGAAAAVAGLVLAASIGLTNLSHPPAGPSPSDPVAEPRTDGWAPSRAADPSAHLAADAASGPVVTVSGPDRIAAPTAVRVSIGGFQPYAAVAVALCPADRPHPQSAGDCGPSTNGAARLVTVDGDGAATTSITISPGPLHNQALPAERCGSSAPCVIAAIDIHDTSANASAPIPFSADS